MRIAVPVENGRLNAHFGGSREFAIIEVDPVANTIQRTEILPAPKHEPGVFPRWLQGLGVQLVIAGGIGERALMLFARQRITVLAGTPNEPAEKVVEAYLQGLLKASPAGCTHHGEHHDHGHHHAHGHACQEGAAH